ncbi:putative MFS monocarboxylate transporter [Aulographum hederae CBS 113979]|uniref:Putative MFS monocarboxylate transporter n=1 Tax=Aulographum hederae CBS 113979 TaxID=1176131 RepID=A0A6G1HBU8_9PEZI|nr:putative MFS monocarboxylate transporter [Aulographum hederae CBS 113979]
MLYFPILSIAPEYFTAHRGAAMGFILSGAGVGGLVLSPLIRNLLSNLGVRWTLRILALINLAVGLPIALSASPSLSSTRRPTLVNIAIAKKPTFLLSALAALLQASGNFVPLTFLPDFSLTLGYTAATGALLLSVNNGVNSSSRILMGFVADRFGRQNTLVVSVLASAVSVWALWLVAAAEGTKGPWIAFVVVYGLTAGGYNALFPTTITEVFGIQAYASVNGFVYFVRGLGAFFGSPVGGVILGEGKGNGYSLSTDFEKVVWYDGALLLASSLCVIGVRGFDAWDKKAWRWKA